MRTVFLQYLPVLVVCLVLKGCRTSYLMAHPSPLDYADALGPELGLHLAILGVVGLVLRVLRGRIAQAIVQVGLGVLALLLILLELVAVSFAAETGGDLDHHLFQHALANLLALLPLIFSEISPGQFLTVVLVATALVGGRLWQIVRQTLPPIDARACGAMLAAATPLLALLPLRVPPGVAVPIPLELALGPVLRPARAASEAELELPPFAPHAVLRPRRDGEGPVFDNLVIVALESTSWGATSLGTPERDTTPFLRELARSSVVFERAYVVVPHSSKAAVSINCGITPYLLMQVREALPGGLPVKCLPQLLKEQRFQTLYMGSHVGDFENWFWLMRNLGFGVTLTKERLDTKGFEEVNYFAVEDNALLRPTRQWLRRARGKRLFTFYQTSTAHHDYRVPSHQPRVHFSDDEKHDRYLNAVRYQDGFLERLWRLYQDAGIADRTLLVVLGDHGEAFGEHGRTLHDHVIYEEGIHIPLLLHGRGLAPQRIPWVVSQLDLLPTVTRLLGFEIEGGDYEGHDLFQHGPSDVAYVSCWYSERCMARVALDRVVISNFRHAPPQAFDLANDPLEKHDVFGANPDDRRHLSELRHWKEQHLGRWLAFYAHQRQHVGG